MDYRRQLGKQLEFLNTSCALYDSGKKDEAVRIATAVRVVVHDTGASRSLLAHLSAEHARLLSTCEDIPAGVRFWANLTTIELDPPRARAEYLPKLATARTKRLVDKDRWWSGEFVYLIEPDGIKLTRRNLVLAAANKDGGAHVDRRLDPVYETILAGARWTMTTHEDGIATDIPFKHGHLAALRQIGYEVLNSPDILRLC